jgi:uncharacterized protein YgfB (UPF0149 family)
MHNVAGGASVESDDRNDWQHEIVSDLVSLIEHVRASMKLIESAIARESSLGNQEFAADVLVLDDVTPRYEKANAVLNVCNAGLGLALQLLLDSQTSKHRTGVSAERDRR